MYPLHYSIPDDGESCEIEGMPWRREGRFWVCGSASILASNGDVIEFCDGDRWCEWLKPWPLKVGWVKHTGYWQREREIGRAELRKWIMASTTAPACPCHRTMPRT